jgi:serine/threonine protein kinase
VVLLALELLQLCNASGVAGTGSVTNVSHKWCAAFQVKIADFGLTCLDNQGDKTAEIGTYRWMAPEVSPFDSLVRGWCLAGSGWWSATHVLGRCRLVVCWWSDTRVNM